MFVVIGGEPLIHHIEFCDSPVLGWVISLPDNGELPAVEGSNLLTLLILRGQPCPDDSFQPLLDLPA